MPGRAELLYKQIKDRRAIDALINEPEDGHLDCKEWPAKDKDGHEMLAKAVCGFANSDGGVLVIGMRAKSVKQGEPDVITETAPVSDTNQVCSRILTLVGNLVEPPIAIKTRRIAQTEGSRDGFVVAFIPRSDGPPHRSRKDWKFYFRSGSGTFPMDYWQIEDRFGARPHAKLELHLDQRGFHYPAPYVPERRFILGLKNSGRGIARFPGILFRSDLGLRTKNSGIDGQGGFSIRLRPSEFDLIIFGGSVDDVVYPGQTLMIAHLLQDGEKAGSTGRYIFKQIVFQCDISCEACNTLSVEQVIPPVET